MAPRQANYQGLLQYGYVWLGPAGIGSEAANILANNQTQLFQGFLATVPRGAYSPKWNTLGRPPAGPVEAVFTNR